MKVWTRNRLLVVGPEAALERFRESHWQVSLRARHAELLETSGDRYGCQFETDTPPVAAIQPLSTRFPELVFLLDYEIEDSRIKGLAKARAGQLEHWETSY